MNKLIVFGIIGILTFSFVIILNLNKEQSMDNLERPLYQGPVPVGYDEDYFRQTGITKKLGEK